MKLKKSQAQVKQTTNDKNSTTGLAMGTELELRVRMFSTKRRCTEDKGEKIV